MPKALCIAGMAISGLVLLLFGLDLATGFPFGAASSTIGMVMDIGFAVFAGVLGYLSWATMREQV